MVCLHACGGHGLRGRTVPRPGFHAGWGEPSSSNKPQQAVPEGLRPLLHECCAMFDLLLPYVLKPSPVPAAKAAGAIAEQMSAAALHSPRLRNTIGGDSAAPPEGVQPESLTLRGFSAADALGQLLSRPCNVMTCCRVCAKAPQDMQDNSFTVYAPDFEAASPGHPCAV